MKTLYIIRHAKSSWDDPGLSDFDRPLNERGKKDAPRMGKRLREKNAVADIMVSSPAKRAISTCKRIAEELQYSKEKIQTDERLYHADEDDILSAIRNLSEKHSNAFLFGHNPGLTDFVNSLNQNKRNIIDNVPTCGVVCFRFQSDTWKEIKFNGGELVFFDFPKSKDD